MPMKRKASSYASRYKRARTTGTYNRGTQALANRLKKRVYNVNRTVVARVNNLYRMIETKESARKSDVNVALAHNLITVVSGPGGVVNPFLMAQGTEDPMNAPAGNRIGDKITVKGLMIKGMFENALARPKVFYRVMLLRGAKGETFDRSTIFKGLSGNRMIDQVNTERFTIIGQKVFNISASNVAASGAEANGAPLIATAGGVGSRLFKMWIPGYKLGRGGNMIYENGSSGQIKFYDYRICILVYDWYGSPDGPTNNNVGRLNEMYTKLYFKDA